MGAVVVTADGLKPGNVVAVVVTGALENGWLPDVFNVVEVGILNGFAIVVVVVLLVPQIVDVVEAIGKVPKQIRKKCYGDRFF